MSKRVGTQNDTQAAKASGKEKVTCKGCDKEFMLLLSHLERTVSCQDFYDMSSMRKEVETLTKVRNAQKSRERYHSDPDESLRKKAASKEYYKKHAPEKRTSSKRLYKESPKKKKESMRAYNEKHRSDINKAMRDNYNEDPQKKKLYMSSVYDETKYQMALDNTCPICEENFCLPKDMKIHVEHSHTDEEKSFTCQICDKNLHYKSSLERHMKEVHAGEKYVCDKCPATFTRKSSLNLHKHHHLSYYCSQCKKNVVFKSFGALLQHVIVKQSEKEMEFPKGSKLEGQTFIKKKSGMLVTCKAHYDSTQEEEGRYLEYCSKDEKEEAYRRRMKRKEEIINEGLKAADGPYEKPTVKVEFVTTHDKKTHHQEEEEKGHCKYCLQKIPFEEDDQCKERNERTLWELQSLLNY